jgi:hypothetical protein
MSMASEEFYYIYETTQLELGVCVTGLINITRLSAIYT